jgi:hypothetical protein
MSGQELDQRGQPRAIVIQPGHVFFQLGAVRLNAIAKLGRGQIQELAEVALVQVQGAQLHEIFERKTHLR